MKLIYGIDPGPVESALVAIDPDYKLVSHFYGDNQEVEKHLEVIHKREHLAIEFIQSYGTIVGKNAFFTCKAVGRFEKSWKGQMWLYARPTVKGCLVGGVRGVKAKHVRAALMQRFGLAKKGYPLYGISRHKWDALAVAVVHLDCIKNRVSEHMVYP